LPIFRLMLWSTPSASFATRQFSAYKALKKQPHTSCSCAPLLQGRSPVSSLLLTQAMQWATKTLCTHPICSGSRSITITTSLAMYVSPITKRFQFVLARHPIPVWEKVQSICATQCAFLYAITPHLGTHASQTQKTNVYVIG